MADKTLSDGCLIFSKEVPKDIFSYWPCFFFIRRHIDDYQIIWHPVRINDCINTIYVYNNWDINIIKDICDLWINKLCPIEQCWNDECIDYLYNYIKNARGNG
jgi:hypothetical protein